MLVTLSLLQAIDGEGEKKSVKSNLAIHPQLWDINRSFYEISFSSPNSTRKLLPEAFIHMQSQLKFKSVGKNKKRKQLESVEGCSGKVKELEIGH